jgi:hypothetical protein
MLPDELNNPLKLHQVGHLFIKLFDVAWNETTKLAMPVGLLNMKDSFPTGVKVTPVVFITNEALRKTSPHDMKLLAVRVCNLIQKLTVKYEGYLSSEMQIDCDWTLQTKESYFKLLEEVKQQPFFQHKVLSVTIRLHQVKYINENGVPPADRGLLMCYNMGNLRDPAAKNSIIDPAIFKSYTGRLADYPLPLDIALPLFDWWVWFRNKEYYGLVHSGNLPEELASGQMMDFQMDTVINGFQFFDGDQLRHENSPVGSIEKIIDILPEKFKKGKTKLLLFHLDSTTLSKYTKHEIEDFYRHFD